MKNIPVLDDTFDIWNHQVLMVLPINIDILGHMPSLFESQYL